MRPLRRRHICQRHWTSQTPPPKISHRENAASRSIRLPGGRQGELLMSQIKFGTDGWRAVIAEDFTFKNVDRVAQATADYFNSAYAEGTEKRAVVGYDRRFLSDQFALRVAEVLAGNGLE